MTNQSNVASALPTKMISVKQYLPLVVLTIIYMAIALTQMPIVENIWQYSFDDGTYSHASLIPFISIYLYWNLFCAGELLFNNKVNYVTLLVTLLLGYALFVFSVGQFPTGYRIGLILFTTSIIALIFKPSIKSIFPSLFLIYLVPIWGILTPYLQDLSTAAVTLIMSYSGIPTYVDGNFISIPPGVFEIAGGCSGLRYLLVSLAISNLFIFLNVRTFAHGFWFLTAAIIGALITNWIRITVIIFIGYYTNMESDLMHDHNSLGWYLYIPFLISLFYFGHRFIPTPENSVKLNVTTGKVNTYTLSLVIFLIFLFSDNTKQALVTPQGIAHVQCNELPENLPLPQLHNNPKICLQMDNNKTNISYKYAGNNLGESVNFYLNNFTPENWKIITQSKTKNKQTLLVKKRDIYYFISYAFKSGNKETPFLSQLRKYKLLSATKGAVGTELIWIIERCDSACIEEKTSQR